MLFFKLNDASFVNSYNGMIIDSSGNIRNFAIYTFDTVRVAYKWDIPTKMERWLSYSVSSGKTVDADTLRAMQALIAPASNGTVTYGQWQCMDCGICRYGAFMYDSLNSQYDEVICAQFGEQPGCNSSNEARTIGYWLGHSIDTVQFLGDYTAFDSCLQPVSVIAPVYSTMMGRGRSLSSIIFQLDGKKVHRHPIQMTVGTDGTTRIDFKRHLPDQDGNR